MEKIEVFVSDNISVKGEICTSGLKFLKDYTAIYTASCVDKLNKAGYKVKVFPCQEELPLGGLIRVGSEKIKYKLKTIFNLIDKCGLFSRSRSLETINILGSSLEKMILIASVFENESSNNLDFEIKDFTKEFSIEDSYLNILDVVYKIIVNSETASSLSRIDGIRYGNRIDKNEGFDELYIASRDFGFGEKLKKEIIFGNYAISSNFSGDLYQKAMNARAIIEGAVEKSLESCLIARVNLPINEALTLAQISRHPLLIEYEDNVLIEDLNKAKLVNAYIGQKNSDLALLKIAKQMEANK